MKTSAFGCSGCGHDTRETIDTRARLGKRGPMADIPYVYRRHRCRACGHRWTTYELDAGLVDELVGLRESVRGFVRILEMADV